jgi:tryptophan halogenase
MTKTVAIVGGGSAGIIAATYIKSYWKSNVNVILIYDHSKPGIGVGESLTPAIYKYLDQVGVTREELVKNVNATVKLGLKFKNWLNDGGYYYHNFSQYEDNFYNLVAAYDYSTGAYDNDTSYSRHYMENCVIPINPDAQQSLHIDAVLFSKYIEQKFKDQLTIIDDEIVSVQVVNNHINELVLKTKGTVKADFYIDATGFNSMLMKSLNNTWIDKTDWLPIDRCIPNPVITKFDKQPPYTTSEATKDGWILQVPLSNRWGTGYLYSSQFTSDEHAFEQFSKFVTDTYGVPLTNTSKVLSFKSGYWKDQWVGNCIAVGLSSGFSEPLEATNIHHTIEQIDQFVHLYSLKYCQFDVMNYNKLMTEFYENVYLYLRFCYTTNRTDSKFWSYMTNNTPQIVKDLEEKVKFDFLTFYDLLGPIFSFGNFTRVAIGLQKCDPTAIKNILEKRGLTNQARNASHKIRHQRQIDYQQTVDHKKYINFVKGTND